MYCHLVCSIYCGSFTITKVYIARGYIHTDSCVEGIDSVYADKELKAEVFRPILEKYSVTKLEITGACVYRLLKPQEVSSIIMALAVFCLMITIPLTESPCHSVKQQWSTKCSISWSHWTCCFRVCD